MDDTMRRLEAALATVSAEKQVDERWGASGSVEFAVIRGGRIVETRCVHNMVVNLGLAWMAGALSGDTAAPSTMKYIGVGTDDDPPPAEDDAALNTQVETRATGLQSLTTVTDTDDTYECVGTVTASAPRALVEAGLFSAAVAGTMLARTIFAVVNLAALDSIQITWRITFSRA